MNTAYNPRSLVIGSRDHFCIHPQISLLRGFMLNTACKKASRGLDPCAFFKNREFAKTTMSWDPLDIEELHEVGKRTTICPYYANKDRVTGADIVFMPYQYLVDEKIRENFDISYENACIIFDEAHNVAQCAEDVSSFELKSKLLEGVAIELQRLQDERRLDDDRAWEASEEDLDCLLEMAQQMSRYLDRLDLNDKTLFQKLTKNKQQPSNNGSLNIDSQHIKGLVLPGSAIFPILFEGTRVQYLERVTQNQQTADLEHDFYAKWDLAFQRVLADIGALTQF